MFDTHTSRAGKFLDEVEVIAERRNRPLVSRLGHDSVTLAAPTGDRTLTVALDTNADGDYLLSTTAQHGDEVRTTDLLPVPNPSIWLDHVDTLLRHTF